MENCGLNESEQMRSTKPTSISIWKRLKNRSSRSVENADLIHLYIKFYSILWVGSYLVFIFITEYLNKDRQIRLLSFYAQDGPGNVDPACLPDPIGVHYFGDLVSAACHSRMSAPYLSTYATNYFPLSYFVLRPFDLLMRNGLPVVMAMVLIISVLLIPFPIYLKIRKSKKSIAFLFCILAVFLSQPFLSILDRGNIQFLVTGFVVLGLYFIDMRKTNVSPVLIGLGAALKGYPVVFAFVFLRRREWRRFTVSISVAATTNLAALVMFPGGLSKNFEAMIRQLRPFTEVETQWLRYNTSFKALLLSIVEKNDGIIGEIASFLNRNYQIILVGLALLITALILNKTLEIFHFLILCSIFSSALIDLSATYTLSFFFSCFMFFEEINRDKKVNYVLLACLAIVLTPKGISVSPGGSNEGASLISFVNPSLMLIMLGCITFTGLRNIYLLNFRRNDQPFA